MRLAERQLPRRARFAAAALLAIAFLAVSALPAQEVLASDDFEGNLDHWRLEPPEQFEIVSEPGTSNQVLQLTPKRREFAHVILADSTDWRDVRIEGRFLFPTEGDGYLGLLYNYQQTAERMDFGCLYVKSNGSYVRVSPHHDGNPSWRLYPELQVDLEGERRIRVGTWYTFRLDVRGRHAALFIDDVSEPLVTFDLFPNQHGAIGLEARPGAGEPVWVDDIRVSNLTSDEGPQASETAALEMAPRGDVPLDWEILGPFPPNGIDAVEGSGIDSDVLDPPELPAAGWQPIEPDARGALITGRVTQFRSGDNEMVYLRATLDVAEDAENTPTWLAVSSANRLDVWLNGYYRGTVGPERFIWPDYLTSHEHPGARLPLQLQAGENELVLRVHGRRFAGGGLYAALTGPPSAIAR